MITKDGYAAVPWGDSKYVIIHNGFQIADVDSAEEAVAFIREQQKKTKTNKKTKSKGRLTLD
jgi:hydrogenase maturation factor